MYWRFNKYQVILIQATAKLPYKSSFRIPKYWQTSEVVRS